MQTVAVTDQVHQRNQTIEDEIRHAARYTGTGVLITADSVATVKHLARRIHTASGHTTSPFVQAAAADLPNDKTVINKAWTDLFEAARGGTLLVTTIEHMPLVVQEHLIEKSLNARVSLERAQRVRLIAGTTTNLYERVIQGAFSERLFYQLNTIHVVARHATAAGDRWSENS
jgi:DNA-binding NtrC family response regulator